jgi:8-oxo-dGTP pyrophosphatase MutT (NUDIX family)
MEIVLPAEGTGRLPAPQRWDVLGRRALYSSPWVGLDLVTVTPPGRDTYDHHVVRVPDAVGVVLHHPGRGVLMLHRHRFITGTTGFEIPAGGVDEGESVAAAAAREVLEETGWTVRAVRRMFSCSPSDGVSDQRFHLVRAVAGEPAGEPADAHESSSRVWIPRDRLPGLIEEGRVPGALSTVALLYALQFGLI